jgi:hypothetical protein
MAEHRADLYHSRHAGSGPRGDCAALWHGGRRPESGDACQDAAPGATRPARQATWGVSWARACGTGPRSTPPSARRAEAPADGARALQKSPGLLCQPRALRAALLPPAATPWPVSVRCAGLAVSRRGCYASGQRHARVRAQAAAGACLARGKAMAAPPRCSAGRRRMATP